MAPQALFTMNNELVEKESEKLAALALKESSGDLQAAVDAAYRRTLGRKPSRAERDYALTSIEKDPALMKELAWLLFNLDEFLYVR
jgi:alpha-D-ribose 1-methylphosphonate 5-triphosphate synthase subunit PhnI